MLPVLEVPLGGPASSVADFRLADNSAPPRQQTSVRVLATRTALTFSFRCVDSDAWGSLRERDAPVYKEECVEVFLAPGPDAPRDYFEFQLSPLGTFFDARIHNPTGRRESLSADKAWDATGARWSAKVDPAQALWTAKIHLPWAALGFPSSDRIPRTWRINLYRIDRPRDGSPTEFSCWSPTLADPPNFHLPERFGTLRLL